jgi:senataxin
VRATKQQLKGKENSNLIGFLNDERRMNVALTRAKHTLIVIGNSQTLNSNETWSDFLNFMGEKKYYINVPSEERMENVVDDYFFKRINKELKIYKN